MTDVIRVGSRGSRLALVQAEWVRERVARRHPGLRVEIEVLTTKGDKLLDAPLAKLGDKGLFTKELEVALLDGRIDLAVHSAKDMPTAVPDGLAIVAVTEREDARDVFVADPALLERHGAGRFSLDDVPRGAKVGSSSLRRRAQLLALRPDQVTQMSQAELLAAAEPPVLDEGEGGGEGEGGRRGQTGDCQGDEFLLHQNFSLVVSF